MISGAVLTGIIGFFVVVACAATLHPAGSRSTTAATPRGRSSRSPDRSASLLFGLGLLGAGLLAAAIVPLSTAYSVCEAAGRPARLDERLRAGAALLRLLPRGHGGRGGDRAGAGAPLVPVLYLTQALNAILLLAILPFMIRLGRDPDVLGEHHLTRSGVVICVVFVVAIAIACAVLLAVTLGIG